MQTTHPALNKPKLRGVSHLIAFFCALIAGAWIMAISSAAYIAAGFASLPYFRQFYETLQLSGLIWILSGGLLTPSEQSFTH